MSKLLKSYILIMLLFLLTGCSALREEARGTYDPVIIIPGAEKATIDDQLGLPRLSDPNNAGQVTAYYHTSRVYEGAPDELANEKAVADFFTLGLAEIINGFGFADNSRQKDFTILYSPDNKAIHIELTCKKDWGAPESAPETYSFTVTGYGSNKATCVDVPSLK